MATFEMGQESVLQAVAAALEREVEKVLAEEAELAAQRCRVRVQEEVGRIATGLLSHYRLFMQGRDELHIVVKIGNADELSKGGR